MAPPKKDAFSDLFNYAQGSLLRLSPSSSLNNLSQNPPIQNQPKPTTANTLANFDVLSPSLVLSPAGSQPLIPVNARVRGNGGFLDSGAKVSADDDPFAVFETKATFPLQNLTLKDPIQDPFDIFQSSSQAKARPSRKTGPNRDENDDLLTSKVQTHQGKDVLLLEDEFTDAFTSSAPGSFQSDFPIKPYFPGSLVHENPYESAEKDPVLAALMPEGLPINVANKAINGVGPDLEKCTRLIVMSSVRPESRPNRDRRGSQPKDLGDALQDMSNDVYKKATRFLDKLKKSVIKTINNLQNLRSWRDGDDMPAWISNQHKYKSRAIERRNDGGTNEDFGTDEENINAEEIRRIVHAQREKDLERQRQRLEFLDSSNSLSSQKSATSKAKTANPIAAIQTNTSRSVLPPVFSSCSVLCAPTAPAPSKSRPARKTALNSEPRAAPEANLLGPESLHSPGLSRAQQVKETLKQEASYVSPSSRRKTTTQLPHLSLSVSPRPASSGPLNTFAQSDYDTNKAKGAQSFSHGDYDDAFNAYTKCLQSLPEKHELRIVIFANLALTAIKIGNYRLASENCDHGLALVGDHFLDTTWAINNKGIKYWYMRLLTRKAESLEMLESFEESLDCYKRLVTRLGVNNKKTMDAKRRVNNIVNPAKELPKIAPKNAPKPVSFSSSQATKNVNLVKNRHIQEKIQEEKKFQLHDVVHERVQKWSRGKEDNLRSLLMSLSDVLPQRLGFTFITDKKITMSDLMLTKTVKMHYMKVISNIHPDKLGAYQFEDQMICQAVFVALNKAWDEFKKQNNIA